MPKSPIETRLSELEFRLARVEFRLGLEEMPEVAELDSQDAEDAREDIASPAPPAPLAARAVETSAHLRQLRTAAREGEAPAEPAPPSTEQPQFDATVLPADAQASQASLPPPLLPIDAESVAVMPQDIELDPAQHTFRSRVQSVLGYEAAAQPPKLKRVRQTALEQTIGLRWAGWIGAIVLLIGAGLGVRYIHDRVHPAIWLTLIAAVGTALLTAGEYVFRKIHIIPAASLFGAGIAIFFLDSYVGYAYYHLYGAPIAFALMALTTVLGAAVAVRGKLVSIAVLALIGGNLAPMLLKIQPENIAPFLSYLVMLQVIALVVAQWGRTPCWWTLRGLSLVTTGVWVMYVIQEMPSLATSTSPVLAFSILYAILYHVDLVIASLRSKAKASTDDELHAGLIFGLCVTAALTGAVLYLCRDSSEMVRGGMLVALAIASGIVGLVLRRSSESQAQMLGLVHRIAAAALVILAIPAARSGVSVEIGWGALAIVFAVLAWKLDSHVSRFGAMVTWSLAVAHLVWAVLTGMQEHRAPPVWLTVMNQLIVSHLVIAWALTWAGHVVARLVRSESVASDAIVVNEWLVQRIAGAASLLCVVATVVLFPSRLGATLCLVVYAWMLTGAGASALKNLHLDKHALAVLGLATVKWAVADTLAVRLSPEWQANQYTPVLNPVMGMGVLLAVSVVALYALHWWQGRRAGFRPRPTDLGAGVVPVIGAVILLMGIGLSFEVDRAIEQMALTGAQTLWRPGVLKQLSWTALWSLGVATFIGTVMRLEHRPRAREADLALAWACILILAIKFLTLDTLFPRVGSWEVARVTPILNFQVVTAATVVGALALLRRALLPLEGSAPAEPVGQEPDPPKSRHPGREWAGFVLVLVALMCGTFEIDRAIAHIGRRGMPNVQAAQLCFTMWWTIGIAAVLWRLRRIEPSRVWGNSPWARACTGALTILAIKYLTLDTLVWRALDGPAAVMVLVNLQALAGAVVLAAMLAMWLIAETAHEDFRVAKWAMDLRRRVAMLAVIVLLVGGTLEVDRLVEVQLGAIVSDVGRARQMAFSIFWSLFAILCIAAGFRWRMAPLRYFALGLFAVTLMKVFFVDLGHVRGGYRVLSFLGLGALLLGTSVLYGKVSPKLLREAA